LKNRLPKDQAMELKRQESKLAKRKTRNGLCVVVIVVAVADADAVLVTACYFPHEY